MLRCKLAVQQFANFESMSKISPERTLNRDSLWAGSCNIYRTIRGVCYFSEQTWNFLTAVLEPSCLFSDWFPSSIKMVLCPKVVSDFIVLRLAIVANCLHSVHYTRAWQHLKCRNHPQPSEGSGLSPPPT